MKKLIAILAISLLAVTAVFAQQSDPAEPNAGRAVDVSQSGGDSGGSSSSGSNFLIGFKAGIGISRLYVKDTQEVYDNENLAGIVGWQIGARMGYFFNNMFGIIVDLEYIKKGFDDSYWLYKQELHLHYLDVNLMFAVKAGGFYGGIGIYAGFKMSAKYYQDDVATDVSSGIKSNDFGLVLTLGFMFGGPMKIFVGLDVKLGLTDVFEGNGTSRFEYRNLGVYLNAGILFGL